MHLFETESGDKWVCVACGKEKVEEINENGWAEIVTVKSKKV